MKIIIKDKFRDNLPKLSKEEFEQLEKSILNEGCRDALVIWNNVLINGHHRYDICTKKQYSL